MSDEDLEEKLEVLQSITLASMLASGITLALVVALFVSTL